ncbi:hypothetical protein F5888DRAFT_1885774 [Russula emetica]|nr:hypothetical protein F5888DRAFT_1885774 [Russula emetica]
MQQRPLVLPPRLPFNTPDRAQRLLWWGARRSARQCVVEVSAPAPSRYQTRSLLDPPVSGENVVQLSDKPFSLFQDGAARKSEKERIAPYWNKNEWGITFTPTLYSKRSISAPPSVTLSFQSTDISAPPPTRQRIPTDTTYVANCQPYPPAPQIRARKDRIRYPTNPADKGAVAPHAFIDKLRGVNEHFRSVMGQDAHEFLNCLLNKIVKEIQYDKHHKHQNKDKDTFASNASRVSLLTSHVRLASAPSTAVVT